MPFKELDVPKDMEWNTKKINAELLQGINNGESIDKIAKRLERVTDMNEAAAIRNARTMVTSFENLGRFDSLKDCERRGIDINKTWLNTHDEKTRDTHADYPLGVGGESVPLKKKFSNGLEYPGDPAGPPAEVYNCRCSLSHEIKGIKGD